MGTAVSSSGPRELSPGRAAGQREPMDARELHLQTEARKGSAQRGDLSDWLTGPQQTTLPFTSGPNPRNCFAIKEKNRHFTAALAGLTQPMTGK